MGSGSFYFIGSLSYKVKTPEICYAKRAFSLRNKRKYGIPGYIYKELGENILK